MVVAVVVLVVVMVVVIVVMIGDGGDVSGDCGGDANNWSQFEAQILVEQLGSRTSMGGEPIISIYHLFASDGYKNEDIYVSNGDE